MEGFPSGRYPLLAAGQYIYRCPNGAPTGLGGRDCRYLSARHPHAIERDSPAANDGTAWAVKVSRLPVRHTECTA